MKKYLFISLFCLAALGCKKETAEQVPEGVAKFYLGPLQVTESTTIVPINNSKDAVAYLWDFGNGKTSKEETPTIYFGKGGTYTISLTVTNAAGLSSTTKQEIKVLTPVIQKITIADLGKWSGQDFQSLKKFKGGDVWVEIYKADKNGSYNQQPNGLYNYPLYYKSPVYKNVPANFAGPVVIDVNEAISLSGKLSKDVNFNYAFALYVKDESGTHMLFSSEFIASSFFPKWGDLNFDWTSTFANTTVTVGCTYQ